jgi:tol-pal system protein YbgF
MGFEFVKTPSSPRLAGAALFVLLTIAGTGAPALDLTPSKHASARMAQADVPPAPIPGGPADSGQDGDPAALVVRLDHLEAELRHANGQIEELQNQNRRLEDQLKRFREDVEYRLGGTPAGGAAPAPVAALPEPAVKPRKNDAFDPGGEPNALGAPRPLGSTSASAPLGAPLAVKPPPPASAPLDLGHPAPVAPVKSADTGPTVISSGLGFTDGPREQLNQAVEAYKAGQYADAEAQLKAFLAANPTHARAADAIFYLGETYLQRSRPREAAEQYLKLSTDYAKSPKAPEGMMRLGQSLAMLGNNEQACATFAEVGKRYPTASASVKKAVEREIQSRHCQ